jgi:hypothetical protein
LALLKLLGVAYHYNFPAAGGSDASARLPLSEVKSSLLAESHQLPVLAVAKQVPQHFPKEAGHAHLLEVSSNLGYGDSGFLFGLPVLPECFPGAGESLLQLFGGKAVGAFVGVNAEWEV